MIMTKMGGAWGNKKEGEFSRQMHSVICYVIYTCYITCPECYFVQYNILVVKGVCACHDSLFLRRNLYLCARTPHPKYKYCLISFHIHDSHIQQPRVSILQIIIHLFGEDIKNNCFQRNDNDKYGGSLGKQKRG